MEMDLPWTEKYRPKTLDEVAGQREVVERLKAYVRSRNAPHMIFAGRAGIGKTTAALAFAHDLFDNLAGNFLELNASDARGIDVVREQIKNFAKTLPLDASFKIIFLDEADALTHDAQHALRRTMEKYAAATRFILSCNYSSKIIEPIQSRCAVFRFKPLGDEDIARLLERVAKHEKLHVSEAALKAIIYISEGDMRKAINALQGAAALGAHVDEKAVYQVSSRARPAEIREMVQLALKGEFLKAREALDALMLNYGMSGEDVLMQVYREVTELDVPDKTKIELVEHVGEYDFRIVEGANERVQLEALLARIMLIGESLRGK